MFWCISHLANNQQLLKRAIDELEAVFGPRSDKEIFNRIESITTEQLNKTIFLKKCILEAIRMYSPGMITRRLTQDLIVDGYTIPKGNFLMLSPYWAHRNASKFTDPLTFNPDRWDAADLDRNKFLDGFIAFGGGRYMCPGRWFALSEMHLFLLAFLATFDLQPTSPVLPAASTLHLVGVQEPETPHTVAISRVQTD